MLTRLTQRKLIPRFYLCPAAPYEAALLADYHLERLGIRGKSEICVYAIGDVTSVPLKIGRPLPKAGIFAHAQAEVIAHNIAAEWLGSSERKSFDGNGQCFIEIGRHRAGIGKGNFYAEPSPAIDMKAPSFRWHLGKVAFEKYWLWKWF